jgi:hypothetical protein
MLPAAISGTLSTMTISLQMRGKRRVIIRALWRPRQSMSMLRRSDSGKAHISF